MSWRRPAVPAARRRAPCGPCALPIPAIRPAGSTDHLAVSTASPSLPFDGETIAAALSAAGIVTFRHTQSGAPRGLHCGMGACFDCLVTVDGRIGQRACMTKVADGMQVSGAAPDCWRRSSQRPSQALPDDRTCDVLVVGGGPAGLSAAIAAAEAGAASRAAGRTPRPGRPVCQAARRQPYRHGTRRAVPARRRSAPPRPRRERDDRTRRPGLGRLRPARDRRPGARPRGHLPPAPSDPRARRA